LVCIIVSKQGFARLPAITAILSLFGNKADSVAMIKLGMYVLKKTPQHLNNGQMLVFTQEQPLHSIAKRIQWMW